MPPFGHPFGGQNRSKNLSEIGLLKRSFQDRPKTAQDPPKMPPGPLRRPQDALPDTLGRPKNAPRCPPEPPRTTQNAFRSIWASNLFRKNQKSRNRRKHVEKKVDHSRPRWSLNTIARKNRKSVRNGRTPEGGGGGRAKRSSMLRPQRSKGSVLQVK